MRSGNPALRPDTFLDTGSGALVGSGAGTMSLEGTVNRTALLLVITFATAMFTWSRVGADPASIGSYALIGAGGGFAVALATIFRKQWAPMTAPLYAALEGLAIGAISALMELRYPGIVVQAVGLTFGTLAALLIAYRSGLVRATENFRLGVVAATGGVALLYLADILMGLFGHPVPFIHEGGVAGIGFSAVVVVIAALNLVLDFDFIEEGVARGAPRYMEWYAAFGLLVTLVWLYLEILRLLGKSRR
jgi:uncharacterized YccA/Bax inhibitor family protein